MDKEKFIEIELAKLRDEVFFLKKCQLDFIQYATIMFGSVITVIVSILQFFKIDNIYNISDPNILVLVLILSILVISFPYFLWIIIHKCRSIFRIVAYIKFIEENYSEYSNNHFWGYENLHSQMKKHPWLLSRISSFTFSLSKIVSDMRCYNLQTSKSVKNYRNSELKNPTRSKIISQRGHSKNKSVSYLGDYYGRLLFFVKLLFLISVIAVVALLLYGIFLNTCTILDSIFYVILTLIILWFLYFDNISRKQLKEIRYRPFSIDSYYDMWNWAFIKMNRRNV